MRIRLTTAMRMVITINAVRRSQKRAVSHLVTALTVIWLLLFVARTITERRVTEDSLAIQKIRLILAAQSNYYSYGGYAGSLAALRALLHYDLASGVKDSYRFGLQESQSAYQISAEPLTSTSSSFYSDETMVLRRSSAPIPATSTSEP